MLELSFRRQKGVLTSLTVESAPISIGSRKSHRHGDLIRQEEQLLWLMLLFACTLSHGNVQQKGTCKDTYADGAAGFGKNAGGQGMHSDRNGAWESLGAQEGAKS